MAEARHAAYIVIDGPGHERTRLALREGITSFGRLPANDVILLGDLVSRHHSRITFFEGRATLQDLGSHNGSWINGERISSRVLLDGDTVRVGNFRITFHQGPVPGPLDDTTAGEQGPEQASSSASEEPEGVAELVRQIESARQGAPSPARAVHFLYRTTDALARAADPTEYAALLLDLALEHVPSEGGAWLRLDERQLQIAVLRGPDGRLANLDIHVPAVEWSVDRRIGVRSGDLSTDLRFGPSTSTASVLSVPLFGPDETSVLYLRRVDRPFEPADLHRLGVIAHLMQDGLLTLARRDERQRPSRQLLSPFAHDRLVQAAPGQPQVDAADLASVVVVDLHGLASTALAQNPRAAFELAARFQELAHVEADARGGFSQPINGHRAMLVFGVPAGAGRPAARDALDAALELRAQVDALLGELPGLGPRRLRAGVAGGPAVSGAFVGERPGFAVFGVPTSSAQRLVDAAGPGRILIDQISLDEAGDGFEARRIGSQPARAGSEAQAIFELIGRAR